MQPELTSIRVMRWVSYVFMGVAVFYATLFWSLGHLQLAITGYFITGILILAAFLLRHEQIQFGKWLLVICTNSAVFYYANSLGQKAGIQLVFFSLIGASLVIFEWEKEKKKAISVAILALLSYLACEWHCYAFFPRIVFSNAILMFIHTTIVCAAVCMLMMPALFYYKLFFNRQAQLQASNTALQTAYADLQLQQKLLEKTWHDSVYAQLTRTIAHELKNPLFEFGMVIGALRTALDDRETALMFIDSLAQTIEELMALLHAMLESGGAHVGDPKEMSLSDVMRRVLLLADGSLKKRNIRLIKDCDDLPILMGDSKSYLMVFSNLIVNAMETMSDDDGPGGTLTIRMKHTPAPQAGRYGICVEIADTGVGIPKSRHATLFSGGQSTKTIDERQRGIGLALVWKLITQMGGEISVHSDPETTPGTMFRIVV